MKNLFPLLGKPLIYYTITASLQSKLVNRTIVSTDNKRIASVAKSFEAEVIKRPKKLASDKINIEPTIKQVLKFLEKNERYIPDVIVLLQNTSPLRTAKHIDEAINLFKRGKFDSILSGFSSHYFFWKLNHSSANPINYNPLQRQNRQQIKNEFIENGAIYITKLKNFKRSNCRISGKIGIYEMPEEESFQIDKIFDVHTVENILKRLKK